MHHIDENLLLSKKHSSIQLKQLDNLLKIHDDTIVVSNINSALKSRRLKRLRTTSTLNITLFLHKNTMAWAHASYRHVSTDIMPTQCTQYLYYKMVFNWPNEFSLFGAKTLTQSHKSHTNSCNDKDALTNDAFSLLNQQTLNNWNSMIVYVRWLQTQLS